MLNFKITATHADLSESDVIAHRGVVSAVNAAFDAGVVTFADIANIFVPSPASAVTNLEFVRGALTIDFVDTDDQATFDGKFAQLEGHFYNIYQIGDAAEYLG
jgi:hypothetical protein